MPSSFDQYKTEFVGASSWNEGRHTTWLKSTYGRSISRFRKSGIQRAAQLTNSTVNATPCYSSCWPPAPKVKRRQKQQSPEVTATNRGKPADHCRLAGKTPSTPDYVASTTIQQLSPQVHTDRNRLHSGGEVTEPMQGGADAFHLMFS
jgi:hypothetical protein